MNRSTPGLPVHHQLPEFTQTHVHRVRDAIQPSQLASLGMINSPQKGILMVTYGIMGNYKSLLSGDWITDLCKVKENLLGSSVGFAGKPSDLLL